MSRELKRYQTAVVFKCASGHDNVHGHRLVANSPEHAQRISLQEIKQNERCRFCGATVAAISLLGTEEISRYPVYYARGYVCSCGERVTVLRAELGTGMDIPAKGDYTCSKGHTRTILNQEFLALETWSEEAN